MFTVRANSLLVEFERWGRIEIPLAYLGQRVSSGTLGGLQHAYALTTHAAQGETFAAAVSLVTDASSTEGVYVGITRGQFDLQAVVIRHRDVVGPLTDDDLPVLREETSSLVATERRLESGVPDRLATELAGLSRAGGEVDTEAAPKDARSTSREASPFSNWSDAMLLDSARRIEQEFRRASADLVRLEADLARRQFVSASRVVTRVAGDHVTAAAGTSRIEVISARIEELTPERDAIALELRNRDIRPTSMTLTERATSLPGEPERLAAEVATVGAMVPSVFKS